MGIEAEAGGSAISRVMIETRTAVENGGDALDTFARVAGVSAAEFRRAFKDDAGGAIISFIQGLGDMESRGESTTAVLDELGFSDLRVADALRRAAADSDGFTAALQLGNQAFTDNTALAQEAATRYDTTAAKIAITRNNIEDAAISFGDVFLPAVAGASEGVADFAGWLSDLDERQQGLVATLAGTAGGAALVGGAFLLAAPRVLDTYRAFKDLKDVSPGTASNLGKVGKAAGVAAAAVTALAIADDLFSDSGMAQTAAEASADLTDMQLSADDLDRTVAGLTHGMQTLSNFGEARGFDSLEHGLRSIANPNVLDRLADVNREITSLGASEGRAERDVLIRQLNAQGQALASLAQSGNTELAADQFELFEDAARAAGMRLEDLLDLMPAYRDALADQTAQDNLAGIGRLSGEARAQLFGLAEQVDAVGVLAPRMAEGTTDATKSIRLLGDVSGWTEEQVTEATEAMEAWQQTLQEVASSFVEPLAVYEGLLDEKTQAEQDAAQATADATEDASDSWEDYADEVDVSLGEFTERLQKSNEDQETWRDNLILIAGRGRAGFAEQLALLGPEAAGLVADVASATDEEFNALADEMIRDAEFGSDGAAAAMDTGLKVMAAVARAGSRATVAGIAEELGLGLDEVRGIAAQYGVGWRRASTRC